MFTGATFPSLLLAALCLVSRAVPYERRLEDLQRGEDKGSVAPSSGDALVSLSLTTPPAGDLLQINSSEEDRRLTAAALLLDSLSGSGPSFSSRLLDATDTWTEADRLRTEEVSVLPSSQDVGTEATMSSEDLPLIFEPFEDVTPAGASSEPSVAMTPAAVTAGDAELERMVSMDTDHTSSDVRLSAALETSGVREPITESHPAEEHHGTTQRDDVTQSAVTHQALGLSEVAHLPASKPKTDTEDPKMKEETDEDEEDEEMDSEEEEEESEEDLTESTIAPHSRPPYGLIPPPPVWVQRNQGLALLSRRDSFRKTEALRWSLVGWLCLGDVGSGRDWNSRSSSAGRRSVQHQSDPSQEEEQFQTPEEEASQRSAQRTRQRHAAGGQLRR
ncbi:uncharacterized protein LOC131527152 isoform X2 [Onychostoma macrolepis]|uniref:uncharacterized protein LOC131527152 isoform X2 n=1 Tax=Onychostoma macrolepis TaxID=369639 RepID=UPI00272A52D0|nr:uncharacterized protein LOC131527152 isoform X2 [Onychostoma macrolepis]